MTREYYEHYLYQDNLIKKYNINLRPDEKKFGIGDYLKLSI